MQVLWYCVVFVTIRRGGADVDWRLVTGNIQGIGILVPQELRTMEMLDG